MQGQYSTEAATGWRPIVKIFCSYAHQNKQHRDSLERHFSALRHLGYIELWHDRAILPGMPWEQEIDEHLDTADLFLPLVSSYFLSSRYCWGREMGRAFERWQRQEIWIAPILVDRVDCQGTLLSGFKFLPTDRRAISEWSNRESAYDHVETEIRKVVLTLLARKWKQQGDVYGSQQRYDLALMACEAALRFDPVSPSFHVAKGGALFHLGRYQEAMKVYEKAISLDPNDDLAYQGMGDAKTAYAPLAREDILQQAAESYQQARLLRRQERVEPLAIANKSSVITKFFSLLKNPLSFLRTRRPKQ